MKKLTRMILILGLIFALSLGMDWEQEGFQPDLSAYLNSPSDKQGSGPKKGPPYTP